MTSRSVLCALVIAAALPQTASAGDLRLAAGAGAAAAGYDPCSYPFEEQCVTPRTTKTGPAPLVLAGYRERLRLRRGWALRFGGTMSAVLVAPGAKTSGSVITGAGEFGVERGPFAADVIVGFSRIQLSNDQMTGSTGTMMMGGSISAKIAPDLAVFGRIDLHAMMHGAGAAAFIGLGLEWSL